MIIRIGKFILSGRYGSLGKPAAGKLHPAIFSRPRRVTVISPASYFASAAGFDYRPSVLASLFQDSAGATPVTATGQTVGRVVDQSGGGRHATQTNADARATYLLDSYGRAILRPDGTNDNLLTTFLPSTVAISMAFFGKITNQNNIIMGAGPSASLRCFIGLNGSGRLAGGIGTQNTANIFGGNDIRNIIGVGLLTADGSRVKLFWDGVKIYDQPQAGTPGDTQAMRVMAYNSGGSAANYTAGDIYRLFAIQMAIPEADAPGFSLGMREV